MKTLIYKGLMSVLLSVFLLPIALSKNGQIKLDAFVSDFVIAVSEHDVNWLNSKIDISAFMDKVVSNSNIKAFKINDFKRWVADSLKKKFSLSLIAELKNMMGMPLS